MHARLPGPTAVKIDAINPRGYPGTQIACKNLYGGEVVFHVSEFLEPTGPIAY